MNSLGKAFLLILFGLAPAALAGEDDAALERYFRGYLEKHFQQQPLDATRLGDDQNDDLRAALHQAVVVESVLRGNRENIARAPRHLPRPKRLVLSRKE